MIKNQKQKTTGIKNWLMYLEIILQYGSSEWRISKLKCRKIGKNEKNNFQTSNNEGTILVFWTLECIN